MTTLPNQGKMGYKPNESEIEEMEAISHYIEYIKLKPNIEDFKVLECLMMMNAFGEKMILKGWTNEDICDYFDVDSMKDVIEKFMDHLEDHLRKQYEQRNDNAT